MCSKPSVSEPKQFQKSQTPVFSDQNTGRSTGRRGTILTGGSGVKDETGTTKKTILGS